MTPRYRDAGEVEADRAASEGASDEQIQRGLERQELQWAVEREFDDLQAQEDEREEAGR